MIDGRILDGNGSGRLAKVHEFKNGDHGLVVATRPYNYSEFRRLQFTDPDFGESMVRTIAYGTPLQVHNGTDTTLWTGVNVTGTAPTFNSTTRAYTGTKSIRWANPSVGSIFTLNAGTSITLSNHQALTFWIYVSSGYTTGDSMSVYATYGGAQVGNKMYLQNYCNMASASWQQITIPLNDMQLFGKTIDAIRFKNEYRPSSDLVYSPSINLDVIQLETTGTDSIGYYYAYPPDNTKMFVEELLFFIADVYDSTLASSSMPKIEYSKMIGATKLNNGIAIKVFRQGEIKYSMNFKCIGDLLANGGEIVDMGYTGSETWMTVKISYDGTMVLQSDLQDYAVITITDSTSDLTALSCQVRGNVEYKYNSDNSSLEQINVY